MSQFDDENPFADPSVQRAVEGSAAGGNAANLNDYNPFEAQKNATITPASNETVSGVKPATAAAAGGGSAVMNPVPGGPPPAYTPSGQQITSADFQRRQEELERRARDLERREEELKNSRAQNYNARQNNWPPIPSFCPFQPCFYQDINVDIPVEFQRIVRNLYYLWVAHVGLLLANMLVALIYLFCGGGEGGQTFGLALVYWAIFTPSSFVCWFRPAYKAFRDDSSFNFMLFFFVFFFQFLFSILYALGIQSIGSCGLIVAISQLATGTASGVVSGILMLLVGVGFAIVALGDFYSLVTIHKLYRTSGASLAKAQAEFASGVMRNEHVQAAAAAAARETVRSQFQGPPGAGGPAAAAGGDNHQAPRY